MKKENIKNKNEINRYVKLIIVILFIVQYGFWGFNLTNLMLIILPTIYIIGSKKIIIDKYAILLLLLSLFATISIAIKPNIESLAGIGVYISFPIYYITFKNILITTEKDIIINFVLKIITVVTIASIIIEALVFGVRITGGLGYTNSFALILFISIYLNKSLKQSKVSKIIEIILLTGLLFTGSRSTLILFLGVEIVLFLKEGSRKDKLINYGLAVVTYVLIYKLKIVAILGLPIIYLILKEVNIKKHINKKMKSSLIALIIILISVLFSGTNTFKRIQNINILNGSFQERIIYYEDAITAIKDKPLGFGINKYEKSIEEYKTANYEVKFMHNSLLQIAYELGIIGGLIALIMIFYPLYKFAKDKNYKAMIIYLAIIIHTFMEFDFSFGSVIGFAMLYIAINTKSKEEYKIVKSRYLALIILIVAIPVTYIESVVIIGKHLMKSEKYEDVVTWAEGNIVKDERLELLLAEANEKLYEKTGKEKYKNESLKILLESVESSGEDGIKLWNIAMNYKEIDKEKAYEYMKKAQKYQGLNPEYYKELESIIKLFQKEEQEEKMEELQEIYNVAKSKQNKRHIYIKNQL